MRNYLLIWGIITLVTSCSVERCKTTYLLSEISKASEVLTLENIKSDIKCTVLEYSDKSIISGVLQKVICDDNYIYTLEYGYGKIFQFEHNGKFVREISRQGRAVNEFTRVSDIHIGKDNNLYIYDIMGKTLIFDTKGNFIKNEKVPFGLLKYVLQSDDFLYESYQAVSGMEQNCLTIINLAGDTIRSFPNHYKFKFDAGKINEYSPGLDYMSLYKFNDEIVYNQHLSDSVFTVDPIYKELNLRYVIKSEQPITPDTYTKINTLKTEIPYGILEDEDYIYFTTFKMNDIEPYYGTYAIEKTTGKYYKTDFYVNDDDGNKTAVSLYWQNSGFLIGVAKNGNSNPLLVMIKKKKKK